MVDTLMVERRERGSTSWRRLGGAQLRAACVDLRKAGRSYDEIARAVGCSRSMAHKAVTIALREIADKTSESADELRTLELARLDALLVALWPAATSGDCRAADRVLRISERRSKLLGLDIPVRAEAEIKLGVDDVFFGDTVEEARKEMIDFLKDPRFQPRRMQPGGEDAPDDRDPERDQSGQSLSPVRT